YICTICTIEPRKNIAIAVRAFGSFLRANPQYAQSLQYIIAGKNGWKSEDVFLAIDEVNKEFSDSVRYVGYLSEHEKWQILVNAKAFLFPTKYEGFGLPVLEAMSVGTPVISTNISSIPEIGADAILYSDPDSEASIADQIQRIVYDSALASELSKKAKEQAKFFSWQKAAK
ncbi:TPA: glycosyltransferase family 1 protein, partial [Candidatus Uhrbacteria bacterium]|nr:glycosyltransferase family 1 protein [Candidatus Uhrbacteria bacterium]